MKVYVIHGSPLSGKSTYVEAHKGPNDLIYDFDLIMKAISGLPSHQDNKALISYVVDIRNLLIAKLKSETKIDNAWIITTKVKEDLKKNLHGLNPIYKEMKIDKVTALQRLKDNPGTRDVEVYKEVIEKYFRSNKDYINFHNTRPWKNKRIVILKRDGYQCRECKRYGKVTEADTVHHVLPIEDRYDLRLDNRNLISLCEGCHERVHNKFDKKLSKLGEELKERTLRKYPELELA